MSGQPGKLLELPNSGHVLIATDLQGNFTDFERLRAHFLRALERHGGDAALLLLGDLLHGPVYTRAQWPDFLGSFYEDRSGDVVRGFRELADQYPGRVHALLGNHEHSHVGGPTTSKFHSDEATALEEELGDREARCLRALLRNLPLVARASNGLIFTHGAPAAEIDGPDAIRNVRYGGYQHCSIEDMAADPVLGRLLWARGTTPELARAFLAALGGRVCLYGHDVIQEGFEHRGDEQLIFSTSYGLEDEKKVYVEVDLARTYRSASELREGHEILPLVTEQVP